MSHREYVFSRILRRFGHNFFCCCFSPISYMYILGFHEKRAEHISFLAFETHFRKQAHCDNKKTDACTSHPVDINLL